MVKIYGEAGIFLAGFKEVKRFGGNYLVSNYGKVFSIRSNKFLKTYLGNRGYMQVFIGYKGKGYNVSVHRLVAEAFCEGYSENLQVNHIDANRLNNHSSNLEWVTAKENIRDVVDRGNHNCFNKPASKAVNQMSLEGKFIRRFESALEASRQLRINQSNISSVCNKKRKIAGKFKWEFSKQKKLKGVG